MTYKKVVENWVEMEARNWLEKMCGEYWFVIDSNVKIEKNGNDFLYEVECRIAARSLNAYERKTYIVGGAIGEFTGNCISCIWKPRDDGFKDLVWLTVAESREALGLPEKFIA